MNKFKQLIGFHVHSDSSLDGAATVSQIIERNKQLGAPYVALTEHGNLNSAMDLYSSAKKAGVKPILGIEAYMVNPFHDEYVEMYRSAYKAGLWKPARAKKDEAIEAEIQRKAMNQYLHITIHFKDEWAYKYFCGLSKAMWARAVKKFDELKPMITLDELKGAAGHITIGSSCMKGPIQNFLMPSRDGIIPADPAKAELMYNWLKEIAGPDSFFIEIFPHSVTHDWKRPVIDAKTKVITEPGRFIKNECTCENPDGDLQKPLNQFVLNLANKYGDKPLISLDSHFATPDQKLIQDCKLGNGTEDWRFFENYYIMSTDEAATKLKHSLGVTDKTIEEWVDNSYAWASHFDNFKIQTNKDRWILAGDSDAFLSKLKTTIDKWGRMNWNDPVMMDRLKKEIQVLAYNGKINLLAYFETVEDIATYCRENGVLINVRGSAGGSLLLYLIGVSSVNPLKHDLSFERFLTEGRIKANTLPDADIDVSDQEKVIEYLKSKYGDNVCRLSTDLLLRIKSSIKDAERAMLGSVRPNTEKLCKTLPATPQGTDDHKFVFGDTDKSGQHYPGLIETNLALKKYSEENPEIWKVVSEMLGIQRSKSTHACGFVIADKPITDYFPIIKVNDEWVTAFSPKSIEEAGGVKFDLLGLNTLRDIQLCLDSIEKRCGIKVNPWDLPYDEKCFQEFSLGHTETVFQFDTPTVKPYLIKIKPKSIDELAAITALCRPGTLDAPSEEQGMTLAQLYVERAQGNRPITYVNDELAPILKDTMGIQLFQEQTLRIYRDVGNFSYEEAEAVRRGIGKKDEKVLLSSTERLREECSKKGWTNDQVSLLVNQIMASARYSFNKSHAVSYAYVAYACMYLKTNFPLDWWKATLTNSSKDEMASKFWKYVRNFTELPDINVSKNSYEIIEDKIIAPFSILNGIGVKAYEQLMKHTPYQSIEHFVKVHFGGNENGTRSAVHSGVARKLIAAGILDSIFPPDMNVSEKLQLFEKLKAEAKDTTRVESVPDEYIGITSLGQYMIKKQLISVYSEDLRELMLYNRGGHKLSSRGLDSYKIWVMQDESIVIDGNQLDWIANKAEKVGENIYQINDMIDRLTPHSISPKLTSDGTGRIFAALAYIVDEKAFPYKDKTKQATKLVLDVNGSFSENILWPPYDSNVAPIGFKGLPCLVYFKVNVRGLAVEKLVPLLKQEDLEKYNMT